MGSLKAFNVQSLKDKYRLTHFVETGTGLGDSLRFAETFGFDRLLSCEVDPQCFVKLTGGVPLGKNTIIYAKKSNEFLADILRYIKGNTLFWLDAHFPGSYTAFTGYDHRDEGMRCPLRQELQIIRLLRDCSKDVIICDDLRIYQHGNYGNGSLPDYIAPTTEGIEEEIYRYSKTHNVEYDYRDEGYLLLTPKQ